MAKGATVAKKGRSTDGLNKAQLIRDALKKLGIDAPAKDVQAYTESHGASIAPAQVSNIRTKMKGKSARKGRKATAATIGAGAPLTANELVQARNLAEKVGGVERAKELLDVLNRLR